MLTGKLKNDATTVTNPDPNSLGTVDPYGTYTTRETPQAAWTTQAATNSKALLMRGSMGAQGLPKKLTLGFDPSGGAAVTMTIKVWQFSDTATAWFLKQSWSLTGKEVKVLEDPGFYPLFVEVDAISAGNVDIYYDLGAAFAL